MKSESDDAAGANCAICQSPVLPGEAKTACPDCQAEYHTDCWESNGGCAVYGCPSVPEGEARSAVEVPVAYWGQERKLCPKCQKEIMAAALRCRHCGAVFESARPVDSTEFARSSSLKDETPKLKRSIVIIFACCLLPFSAPVAAAFAWVWRRSRDEEIRSLPALYSALLTIGCIVAVLQTLTMVVVAMMFHFFSRTLTDTCAMNPRIRRLQADYQRVQLAFANHPRIRVLATEGDPPEKYTVEYALDGLEPLPGGAVAPAGTHRAEIYLPLDYPRRPPFCRMVTPVFHPNIDPSKICIGDHWSAGQSLAQMIVHIGEMICYQSYNIKSPLNAEAAAWASQNANTLPLTRDDLMAGL